MSSLQSRQATQVRVSPRTRRALKSKKVKPTIDVTADSTGLEILRSSWIFLSAFYFFYKLQPYFHIAHLNIDRLEKALMNEPDTPQQEEEDATPGNYLTRFIIHIIKPLLTLKQNKAIQPNNYEYYLFKLFPQYGRSFHQLDLLEKIDLLKTIAESNLEMMTEYFSSLNTQSLRIQPIGSDEHGWVYWYFGDTRLYRELPIACTKKGVDSIQSNNMTFQLACSSVEEWELFMSKIKQSNYAYEKELWKQLENIGTVVINRINSAVAAKKRQIANVERQKELESIPKKRSRRLEIKSDEQTKKQKIEEMEEEMEQMKLNEINRQKRESRLLSEAKRKGLNDAQMAAAKVEMEEDAMQQSVRDFINQNLDDLANLDTLYLIFLRNKVVKKATTAERVRKMQGWIGLLKRKVAVTWTHNRIYFIIDNEQEVFQHVLFRNSIRIYIQTIQKIYENEPSVYEPLSEIYDNWLFDRYQNIEALCSNLSHLFNTHLNMCQEAVSILLSVFE